MNSIILLSVCLTIGYLFLIGYCIYGWISIGKTTANTGKAYSTKISVVIPVRNEEENILRCLQSINNQAYPKSLFEVIISDDGSSDSTPDKIRNFIKGRSPGDITLKYIQNIGIGGKKQAIASAVNIAQGELIVCTDADCVSFSRWLCSIADYYERFHPDIIAGPVCYEGERTLLEKFESLEFIGLQAVTGGFIKNGVPLMCNGANLAYSKKSFIRAGGFGSNTHFASGDDVVMMFKIAASGGSVHFLKSREAIVFTAPAKTWRMFLQQRKRWASKIFHTRQGNVIVVGGIVYLFNASVLINITLAFINTHYLEILLFQGGGRIFFEGILLMTGTSFFKRNTLLFLFLPAQFFYLPYVIITGIISRVGKYQWKGRTVK